MRSLNNCGGPRPRPQRRGAAFGRANSFAASFVETVNTVKFKAANPELVLHLSRPGGLLAGCVVDRIYGGSERHASDWLF